MRQVVHFEIHAADTARAVGFYQQVFGWTITRWDGPFEYYLVDTGEGDGIDGAILPRRGPSPERGAPVNGYVCTTTVESLDDAIAKVERSGGAIVVPKNEIPGIGFVCYAVDTEENIFGMLQPA